MLPWAWSRDWGGIRCSVSFPGEKQPGESRRMTRPDSEKLGQCSAKSAQVP